jgi:AraC family transcriptional regulator
LVFHPAGAWHANRWPGRGGRCFHAEIACERLELLSDHARLADETVDLRNGPASRLASQLYLEYRRRDDATPLAMEGLTLEILAEVSRGNTRAVERHIPHWLLQARDLLHDRFTTNVSIDEVAAAVNIHPGHLTRVFRQHFGCSLGGYLRRLRIEFASHHLATSDRPLKLVAVDSGFADQSHFSKLFKRHTGMTPVQFQDSCHKPPQK